GLLWSAGHQPLGKVPEFYEVTFSADQAQIRRLDDLVETRLDVTVAPDVAAEVRRLTLTNHDTRPRDVEGTSYAEVVLAPHRADVDHPAFCNLVLETEWLPSHQALLCRRRPRAPEQLPVWGVHAVAVEGMVLGEAQCETDRARFLGRGRSPLDSEAVATGQM